VTDKLKETFNLENEGEDEEESLPEFPYDDIPPELSLDDIAHMAVYAYREQLKDAKNIPVKNRSRALDVAKSYLTIAKDAVQQREEQAIKKQTKRINTVEQDSDENKLEDKQSIDRKNVYEMIEKEEYEDR